MPNAGKSSLLAVLTRAKPKIANYQFTTINPNLGVTIYDDKELTLADIPGLIKGAHEGVGLGDKFLRHIERCKNILHLIDINQENLIKCYSQVRKELKKYSNKLVKKKEIVVLNKTDLMDKRFISRFAIFHQRYSTNTFPSWDLAQPFRTLAHNGEINTLKGNINWMKIHEQDMSSKLFDDIESLKPVITPGNSDSAALDNVFELLVRSGKSVPLVKLMLIPDAWSKRRKTVSKAHQHLFNFLNSTIEPGMDPQLLLLQMENGLLLLMIEMGYVL